MGFDRQTDWRFLDFDFEIKIVEKDNKPKNNRNKIIYSKAEQYLGIKPVYSQLENNRLVLYRCHCGSDYCSVISCTLDITEH
ncbi:hypothetical protein [Proteus mirabilis]|uniref:hypothetical protein n=1 Tax=Proteus mirabilis TaxID=584 RepID=UPI0013D82E5B|nr:hypothetical protein [Proteus mirabilis]